MKRLRTALVVIVLFSASCAHPPPNLTPQASVAFTNTRVMKVLDLVRDAVDDGTRTTPPLFTRATNVKVATWHESALRVMHATGTGWKQLVLTSIDELLVDLPEAERAQVAPYASMAKGLIQEVGQ